MELDGRHSKYRDILSNNNIRNWDDFDENVINEVKTLKYTDQQGNINKFWQNEVKRLSKLYKFKSYVENDATDIDFHQPLTWTRQMYDDWRSEYKISADGSSKLEASSRIGKDIDIKPEPALFNLSIPLRLSEEAVLADPMIEDAKGASQ